MTYEDHYEWAKTELAKIEVNRQKVIQDLAARLDAAGLPLEMIAGEIAIHLEGYVSAQYVRRVLDKKYKQDSKTRTNEQNTEKPVAQIAVTNSGKNITQPPPKQTPPPPEDPKENALEIENQFLKEENANLKDAIDKIQQFTPAINLPHEDIEDFKNNLPAGPTVIQTPQEYEKEVFQWLAKRDDKMKCFWYDAYGIEGFKNRELAQLKNSGVKTFKRLYFEV